MKEANLMRLIQMEATKRGHRLLRNNVGKLKDADGRYVAFGVGGTGGSDLIGWCADGKFAAIEVKLPNGKVSPEQEAFINAVRAAGGRAGVARTEEDVRVILG